MEATRCHWGLALAPFLFLVAAPNHAQAQSRGARNKPANDPINCPYTAGDPKILEAAGILSLGGFSFGKEDSTAEIDEYLGSNDVRWIETAHFKIGVGLGPCKIDRKEKARLLDELQRLAVHMPSIKPEKIRILDPWLRAHIYAQRAEDLWTQMQGIFGVTDADFPDGTKPWDTQGKYMGIGPFLGEKGKPEVLILSSQGACSDYLRHYFGLLTRMSQRWNILDRDVLHLVIHTGQGDLDEDAALHGHFVFNLSQQLLDAYKHYSYEIPVWLKEGLAHWLERSINPEHNTFNGSEGAAAIKTNKADWNRPTRALVQGNEAISLAQLVRIQGFGELELAHHYTVWSMIDFLMSEHPKFVGQLLDDIKGMVNEQFMDDGTGMDDKHRAAFKTHLGMSYAQFDRAWAAWVQKHY
ncbi:MAG: hypothetical protein CMJ98_07810 [Planctomycetes bacterium]|jgi:hypothetical protein|nr:hypothetical protein [Planctomycetota bacterium]MBV21576.1 hypothetical protein [Planctomycetaceae bacterium]HJM56644.1 hypothetical protein [Planctomycetota bacterium]